MRQKSLAGKILPLSRIAGALAAAIIMGFAGGCRRNSVESYLEAGRTALQHDHLTQAEQDFVAAQKLSPSDARVHLALGDLYLLKHNTDGARQEFLRAIELEPKNLPARLKLGRLLAQMSRPGLAQEQYLAVLAFDPANVEAHFGLAESYRSQGLNGTAERELRTVIGLAPKDARAHYALATLLAREPGRQPEAQAEFAAVRALDPNLLPPTAVVTEAPAAPAAASTPALAKVASVAEEVKGVKPRRFLLSHDSPVYHEAKSGSQVVAQVHRGKYVMVTGIGDKWLRIRMRSGLVGFIPTTAVE
jgi:tetratricopeptide (TPR) repeat protein